MDEERASDFKKTLEAVHMPKQSREEILKEAFPEPMRRKGTSRRRTQVRSVTRRGALKLVAGGVGIAAAGILGLSVAFRPDGAANSDDGSAAENGFVLAAYAQGTPQGDNAVLAGSGFTATGGWSGGDSGYLIGHEMNFALQGEGIREVTYTLEGPWTTRPGATDSYTHLYFENFLRNRETAEEGSIVAYSPDSVTVPYEEQGAGRGTWQQTIQLYLAKGEVQEPENGFDLDEDKRRALKTELETLFAKKLSESVLVITASYEDGATETKRYKIGPVDDFGEKYAKWSEAWEEDPESAGEMGDLYVIESLG